MVHLTYNDTERRKSAIECKIRAYIPIYPEILLQSVPNQPETIQNAGTAPTGNSLTGSQTAGTDTDQISPERSRQTGAACHGQPMPDFSRLSGRGVCSRFTTPLFVIPEKCFLRLSANFSAELHQITIMRNY